MSESFSSLPGRFRDLDPRTVELLARMNEAERQRLVDLMNLDEYQIERLIAFLSLPEDKWSAGFRIVTRSVVITKASKTVLKMTLGLAAILVALGQIWTWFGPFIKGGMR